ncbi:MAG: multi-sensor hybrid histidine kinase [Pedosphaera sp.]|nr:multi-sensor hybrid histidine kinase [Pedosphaera sp.]
MRLGPPRISHSKERYRSLIAATAQIVWTTDAEGNVTEDIPTWRAFTGQAEEEVKGQGWINALHPEDRERTAAVWSHAVRTRSYYATEYRLRRHDGEYFPFVVRGVPMLKRGGGIREWIGTCSNITDWKRAQDELFNSRQMLRLVLDTIPQRVFWKDRNSVYIGCNKPLVQDGGYSDPSEIIGKTDYEMASLPTADRYRADDRQVMETGVPKFNYEEPQIKPDGTQAWLTTSKMPLRDQNGDVIGVLGTYEDITARKQAEEVLKRDRSHLENLIRARTAELIVAKERAEVANEAKSAFLAKVSHDLRTPLNAILGFAQILQRRSLSGEVNNGLKTIQQSGEHLLTLINDILNLSKIEAGKMELYPTLIHFPAFLKDIAGIIRSRAEGRSLSFVFETPTALPAGVEVDQTRLRQVLLNLLDNAVKFTDSGGIVLRVSRVNAGESVIRQQPGTQAWLRFEVEDTGIGIGADQLERIFLPFEQASEVTRRVQGTGLGLAISRQLVQLMGGNLQVQSHVGRGSRFWFEIAVPIKVLMPEADRLRGRLISGYRGPKRKVLVVDDNLSNREVMFEFLQAVGFEVAEARDGQEAIRLAQQIRPDLILMDLYMPVMDGFEAASQIRRIPELREILIIAASASVSEEDQSQSRQAGYDAFLPKPVNWPKLSALLEKHLKLDWEYEDRCEQAGTAVHADAGETDRFVPPPKAELTVLLELARMGDLSAIQERAEKIKTLGERCVPFADKLSALAQGFEEQEILNWIQECLEVKP